MQVILIYRVLSRCLILAKTGKNFLVQMSMDVQSFCAFLNWQLHTGYFKIYIYISSVYILKKKPLQFVIVVVLHKCSHVF